MFSHFQESRASSRLMVTWEDRHHPSGHPLFLPPPWALIADRSVICYGISLRSAGASCPSCVPHLLLVRPQTIRWQGSLRSRKGLEAVQVLLSSNCNISVSSRLFCSQIQNIASYELLWRKLTLFQSQPVHQQSRVCCLVTKAGLRCTSSIGKGREALLPQQGSWDNELMTCGYCNKASAELLSAQNTTWHQRAASWVSSRGLSLCCTLVYRAGKFLELASRIRDDTSPWRRCVFF